MALFVLQYHWWQKQKNPLVHPPMDHWDLRFDLPNNPGLTHFVLEKNPTKNDELKAILKPLSDRKWMTKEGHLSPGSDGNPTENLPAWIDIVDQGGITVLMDRSDFKKIEFKGSFLRGIWFLGKDPKTENWIMKKKA